MRGPLRLDELARSVAVVGSRSATTYGARWPATWRPGWRATVVAVVSGAAFGIDQAAHRGALGARGSPWRCSPAASTGSTRSPTGRSSTTWPRPGRWSPRRRPGCAPTKLRFLSRNRLIAALSRGTVVVEAADRSGALNTANWATRLHRPVMGVPGPVTSAPSEGVHELLRSGAGTLVTRAADVLELVGPAGDHLVEPPAGAGRGLATACSGASSRCSTRCRWSRPAPTDAIARTAGMGLVEVRSTLERLARRALVLGSAEGWRLAPEP